MKSSDRIAMETMIEEMKREREAEANAGRAERPWTPPTAVTLTVRTPHGTRWKREYRRPGVTPVHPCADSGPTDMQSPPKRGR